MCAIIKLVIDMIRLKYPYISVQYQDGLSYGGSQRMSESKILKSSGCGVVAALDLLLYLTKSRSIHVDSKLKALSLFDAIPWKKYNHMLSRLCRSYFPVIPYHGMNGLGLMAGMQMFFLKNKMPYSCHWCISDRDLWKKVYQMLDEDIPVIMSVGPNFPLIWKKGKAILYIKNDKGNYTPASSVKAHFITITGIDDNWIEISSWGKRFYINRRNYEEYVSKYSAPLVSNILYVKRNNRKI